MEASLLGAVGVSSDKPCDYGGEDPGRCAQEKRLRPVISQGGRESWEEAMVDQLVKLSHLKQLTH